MTLIYTLAVNSNNNVLLYTVPFFPGIYVGMFWAGTQHFREQPVRWQPIALLAAVTSIIVAVALYIRWRLQETPIFQAIKAKGQTAVNPWREAFTGPNLKYVGIATAVP